ncbi:MAG: stage II sporulation protein P [Bacillota bacterium]|nr:stage II sporulation protein P [Bacillota bacterium]
MKKAKKFLILLSAVLLTGVAVKCGGFDKLMDALKENDDYRSTISLDISPTGKPISSPTPEPVPTVSPSPDILPTTISGGLVIKNATSYTIDTALLINQGSSITLQSGQPQILIIHTHSSEAYTPAGLDKYVASGTSRTLDPDYNVIRVGDELSNIFESYGLNVIHDREIYDYPSYTGSYSRSGAAVEAYLQQYPTIKIIIDLHRDALGSDDVIYKVVADETGVCASQIMLLVGTDDSGLEHPNWQENLRLALYIQNAVISSYPTLMRPVQVVSARYNQNLAPGSMILEVGSSGNTLQEALAAIRLFGNAAGPALSALIE